MTIDYPAHVFRIRPEYRFRLAPEFMARYHGRVPPLFGPLGAVTFARTYARTKPDGTTETVPEAMQRVVEYVYSVQCQQVQSFNQDWDPARAQDDAQEMFERWWAGKWSPPGRGIWFMGTDALELKGSAALNNCFTGSEKILTQHWGVMTLAEAAEHGVRVWNREGWVDANIRRFGVQKVQRVTFAPAMPTPVGNGWRAMRSNIRNVVEVTKDHRWILTDGSDTTALAVGDAVLSAAPPGMAGDRKSGGGWADDSNDRETWCWGFFHGLVFGDGTAGYKHVSGNKREYHVRLCGNKNQHIGIIEESYTGMRISQPASYNGDHLCSVVTDEDLKAFPAGRWETDSAYSRGFLDGWLAADGSLNDSGSVRLSTQHNGARAWLEEHAAFSGWLLVGASCDSTEDTNYGPRSSPLWVYTLARPEKVAWKVTAIEELDEPVDVYCAQVPEGHEFTLASGMLTGNCGFVSTKHLDRDFAEPFTTLMDYSMLGVGMGFDVKGAGKVKVPEHVSRGGHHAVQDSREGWCHALRAVLDAHAGKGTLPEFSYNEVRPKGARIMTFGGEASGPDPLIRLLDGVTGLLAARKGRFITSGDITDIMNMIGVCVVSGNVRRSAEIALGSPNDEEFITLKDPRGLNTLFTELEGAKNTGDEQAAIWTQREIDNHPLMTHRWASNNTVLCERGQDYTRLARMTVENGEPGYGWPEIFRGWGRLCDPPTHADDKAEGFNPCGEQTLWDGELCCLGETFPTNHVDLADFKRTLKFVYVYCKAVTCIPTHRPKTNRVMSRNRRIGISMAGVFEMYDRLGMSECIRWWDEGYRRLRELDKDYSGWMGVPESLKITSVKPGGTVPLLWGIEGGMKLPIARDYFRTIRIADDSTLLPRLRAAGYKIEPAQREPNTQVVYFPITDTRHTRYAADVSLWEQAALFTALQRYWADNMVSATLMFNDSERNDVARVLDVYDGQWKAVSFLPRETHGYPQAPYQPSTADAIAMANAELRPLDLTHLARAHEQDEKWCSGDVCQAPPRGAPDAAVNDAAE